MYIGTHKQTYIHKHTFSYTNKQTHTKKQTHPHTRLPNIITPRRTHAYIEINTLSHKTRYTQADSNKHIRTDTQTHANTAIRRHTTTHCCVFIILSPCLPQTLVHRGQLPAASFDLLQSQRATSNGQSLFSHLKGVVRSRHLIHAPSNGTETNIFDGVLVWFGDYCRHDGDSRELTGKDIRLSTERNGYGAHVRASRDPSS